MCQYVPLGELRLFLWRLDVPGARGRQLQLHWLLLAADQPANAAERTAAAAATATCGTALAAAATPLAAACSATLALANEALATA